MMRLLRRRRLPRSPFDPARNHDTRLEELKCDGRGQLEANIHWVDGTRSGVITYWPPGDFLPKLVALVDRRTGDKILRLVHPRSGEVVHETRCVSNPAVAERGTPPDTPPDLHHRC